MLGNCSSIFLVHGAPILQIRTRTPPSSDTLSINHSCTSQGAIIKTHTFNIQHLTSVLFKGQQYLLLGSKLLFVPSRISQSLSQLDSLWSNCFFFFILTFKCRLFTSVSLSFYLSVSLGEIWFGRKDAIFIPPFKITPFTKQTIMDGGDEEFKPYVPRGVVTPFGPSQSLHNLTQDFLDIL